MFASYPEHAEQTTDLTLVVRDVEMRVHSQILSLTSPILSDAIVLLGDGERKLRCFDAFTPSEVANFLWFVYNGMNPCPDGMDFPGAARVAHMLAAENVMTYVENAMVREIRKETDFSRKIGVYVKWLKVADDTHMRKAWITAGSAIARYISKEASSMPFAVSLLSSFELTPDLMLPIVASLPFTVKGHVPLDAWHNTMSPPFKLTWNPPTDIKTAPSSELVKTFATGGFNWTCELRDHKGVSVSVILKCDKPCAATVGLKLTARRTSRVLKQKNERHSFFLEFLNNPFKCARFISHNVYASNRPCVLEIMLSAIEPIV
jgi:hypothetical protein